MREALKALHPQATIHTFHGSGHDVINWIDEDTLLLFLTREGQGSVWRIGYDGSDPMQLATGSYVVGMIANE